MGALVFMFTTGILYLGFHHFFAAAWSNKCDPGNAQFSLIKNDPVVGSRVAGELFTWEEDGPDNGWLCVSPSLSLTYAGTDVDGMFDAARANLSSNGWVQSGVTPDGTFADFDKYVGDQHLEASVSKEWFSVDVRLDAPGLHMGENGFQ